MTSRDKARQHAKRSHYCSCGTVVHGNGGRHAHEHSHVRRGEWQTPKHPETGFRWLGTTAWEASPGGLLLARDRAKDAAERCRRRWTVLPDGSDAMHAEQQREDEYKRQARKAEMDAIDAGAFLLFLGDPERNPYDYEVYATEYAARRARPDKFERAA